ncbi:N-formylglutamate amidohydrolase [Rhizobium puerariae]|uniref:N-formylglutamate amidohydrolase n=1 Tax=Rhizobium puerariae TaxID=1585791 RepID=A0ABV6A9Z6_9HYPH
MVYVEQGIFYRYEPEVSPVPLVVDVSRSGREYPTDMRTNVPFNAIHDNVSMYVDEIWADTPRYGGTMLYALFPHMYIDANRHELDIDPELVVLPWPVPLEPTVSKRGLGLIKAKSRYGEPVQERKLTYDEIEDRLNRYHRPYHRELGAIIDRAKSGFGKVYHLSCHCMSAIGAPTHPDPGQERPDFCVGNNIRGTESSSPEFIEYVAGLFREQGFSCTVNFPYGGGEINRRYGNPEGGIESILVEINKKKFMDVKTFRKNEGFDEIKNAVNNVLKTLSNDLRSK